MLLIAVDTSGKHGSVALCRGDAESFEVLQVTSLEGGTYSARLVPQIGELLEQNKFPKADVDGFSVVSGPGSFTGLRVGLATVKALCEVLGKPLATVSMLEAIAVTYGEPGSTSTVALDAGRGEVYVGQYSVQAGTSTMVQEYIAKLEVIAGEVTKIRGDVLTVDGKVYEAISAAGGKPKLVPPLHADQIGRIGLRKLLAGETVDPAIVDVNYIRRSDAELFSTPKH